MKNLLKLLAVAVSLYLASVLSGWLFETMWLRILFSGIFTVVIFFLLSWIYFSILATKNPDVKAANKLRMSIFHYRKYKEIWEEQIEYRKRGEMPPNRLNEIPNMNEWRRFTEYHNLNIDS